MPLSRKNSNDFPAVVAALAFRFLSLLAYGGQRKEWGTFSLFNFCARSLVSRWRAAGTGEGPNDLSRATTAICGLTVINWPTKEGIHLGN
jgi:hypothetical protein